MNLQQVHSSRAWRRPRMKAAHVGALVVLAAIAMLPVAGQAPADEKKPQDSKAASVANPALGSNHQAQASEPLADKPVPEAASGERKNPIVEDSARLLQMARDLKAEVDKTTKDTLSLHVIRKAAEIVKLAHSVRENKRPMLGAN